MSAQQKAVTRMRRGMAVIDVMLVVVAASLTVALGNVVSPTTLDNSMAYWVQLIAWSVVFAARYYWLMPRDRVVGTAVVLSTMLLLWFCQAAIIVVGLYSVAGHLGPVLVKDRRAGVERHVGGYRYGLRHSTGSSYRSGGDQETPEVRGGMQGSPRSEGLLRNNTRHVARTRCLCRRVL